MERVHHMMDRGEKWVRQCWPHSTKCRHATQNVGRTMQNVSHTTQNVGCTMQNVGCTIKNRVKMVPKQDSMSIPEAPSCRVKIRFMKNSSYLNKMPPLAIKSFLDSESINHKWLIFEYVSKSFVLTSLSSSYTWDYHLHADSKIQTKNVGSKNEADDRRTSWNITPNSR